MKKQLIKLKKKIKEKIWRGGFTLIELLVVISIMSLISAIVTVPLMKAKRKAEDQRRVIELKTIQKAIELQKQDTGKYPVVAMGMMASDMANYHLYLDDPVWGLGGYLQKIPDPPAGNAYVYMNGDGFYAHTPLYITNPPHWICPRDDFYLLGTNFLLPGENSFTNFAGTFSIFFSPRSPYTVYYLIYGGNIIDPYTPGDPC